MTVLSPSRSRTHDVRGQGRAQPTAGTRGARRLVPRLREAGRFAAGTYAARKLDRIVELPFRLNG